MQILGIASLHFLPPSSGAQSADKFIFIIIWNVHENKRVFNCIVNFRKKIFFQHFLLLLNFRPKLGAET